MTNGCFGLENSFCNSKDINTAFRTAGIKNTEYETHKWYKHITNKLGCACEVEVKEQ